MARKLPPETRPGFTPLIDVAFLVLIFFMALPLKRLDGKLEAYLPKDRGPAPVERDAPDVVRLRVRPGPHYELGDHRASDPRRLAPLLKSLGPGRTYEIHASPDVPWGQVVRLVDLLQQLELRQVQFRGAPKSAPSKRR